MLQALEELLREKLPGITVDARKARLLLQWRDKDYFNIYISNKIDDGVRIGFVLDLDVEGSERRVVFEEVLLSRQVLLESALGAKVVSRIKDPDIVKTHNMQNWLKVPSIDGTVYT